MYKPDSREAALLLLHALEERGQRRGKEMTRARLSRVTLKRLWNRENLSELWLNEVNEWLLSAGWIVFYAGTTFGAVKNSIVENWPRVASKRFEDVLDEVRRDSFDFSKLEPLLRTPARTDSIAAVPKATSRSRKVTRKAT
jgi:hypothetical protein